MKSSELWQHPFVDVFKFTNISEWKNTQKEGDVTEVLDRITGKRVFRLFGSISAANNIQIPKQRSHLKTLGLTGRYIYAQLQVPPNKFFSMHFELVLSNSKTKAEEPFRISISNIYKESKLTSSGLQLTCFPNEKWFVACIDAKAIFDQYLGPWIISHALKAINLCSNMFVRGIYTSEILYNHNTLPREMMLKLSREERWENVYDWISFPDIEEREGFKKNKKEDNKVNRKEKKQVSKGKKEPRNDEENKQSNGFSEGIRENASESSKRISTEEEKRESFTRESIKSDSFNQKRIKEVRIVEAPVVKDIENPLLPDPIMGLTHIIGYSGGKPGNVKWTRPQSDFSAYPPEFTQGSSKYLIYPSGCALVLINPVTQKQQFLFAHTSPVVCLALSSDGTLIASGQDSPNPLILIWQIKTRRPPSYISLAKLNNVKAIDISTDSHYLVTAGTDSLIKDEILIWDITNPGKAELLIKQTSNYHINTIKFSPIDTSKLMSCGKENIRSWRINGDRLSGGAVVLNHHAKSTEFLDLSFEIFTSSAKSEIIDEHLKRVFVVNNQGLLFQINYRTLELEGVLQLHDAGIHSIVVSEGFCVTGSKDCYMRVWPLDFSEFYLEAHHEDTVTAVDISSDGLHVVCGTSNCTVGILGMTTNAYKTLLRSHTSNIVALDVHPKFGSILTASEDRTIRVWTPETFEELYEFTSIEDAPITLSFHPVLNNFACGFESGTIRIFEVENTAVKSEFLNHEGKIVKVTHSKDGKYMLSASDDGIVCFYEAGRGYQALKTIPVENKGEFIDICFAPNSEQFAVLGSNKTNVAFWDCASMKKKYMINSAASVSQIMYSPNGKQFLLICYKSNYKVKYYNLKENEAVPVRELENIHPNSEISKMMVSENTKYLVTGGSDKFLRVWDYRMKPKETVGQAFIGHSNKITSLMWSNDRKLVISSALGNDGIFIWEFRGDIEDAVYEENIEENEILAEQMPEEAEINEDFIENEEAYEENPIEPQISESPKHETPSLSCEAYKLKLDRVIGYNATTSNNLIWASEQGWFAYPSGQKIIQTLLRENGIQKIFFSSGPELTTLAISPDSSLIVAGSSSPINSPILVWDSSTQKLLKSLTFHEKGVSHLSFSSDGKYLLSLGVQEEPIVVIWEISSGRVISTALLESPACMAKWKLNSYEFVTAGQEVTQWCLTSQFDLQFRKLSSMIYDYTSLDIYGDLVSVGTGDGKLIVWDLITCNQISTHFLLGNEVSSIAVGSERTTIGGNSNHLMSWRQSSNSFVGQAEVIVMDGYIKSLSFEPAGHEGIAATTSGTIWYINWKEKESARIVSSHLYDSQLQAVVADSMIISTASDNTIRLWDTETFSQITQYDIKLPCTSLAFSPNNEIFVAGFSDGSLQFFSTNLLKSVGKSQPFKSRVSAICWKNESRLFVASETGVVLMLSSENWNRLTLNSEEVGMAGGKPLSLDWNEGFLAAAADSGKISVWDYEKIVDIYNVFENPHGLDIDNTEESLNSTYKIYKQLNQIHSSAVFLDEENVACIASTLQYILIRNFLIHQTTRRIVLSHFPISLDVNQSMGCMIIGCSDNKVLLYSQNTEETQEISGNSGQVIKVGFMPNGAFSAANSEVLIYKF
ncbi:unnamed protein product [Blepharisma stoltei]|uniref:Uncharacterized protein n=1 Tax=Blepharisma stoltei TaxID=1481888 RepID=A0AAU9I9T8_9CILI|nr:unnamed protein product [Blepharisma stoltei]